ncbi:hypothetical protein AAG906_030977 [Vitis piasezkii]
MFGIYSGEDAWEERRKPLHSSFRKRKKSISSEIGQFNSESAPDRPWNLRFWVINLVRRRNLAGLAMDCLAYEAARDGEIDFLKRGFKISEVLDQKTIQQKDNLLHIAANFGQVMFAREAIRLNPGLLSQANMKGDTPLHTASRTGCPGMVELFISLCDDVERTGENAPWNLLRMVNQEGDTALHAAVKYDHLDVVKLLVKADIELLHMDNKANESPLYLAVERGLFDFTKHMLDKCPKCSHRGTKGLTALHAAVVRTHQGNLLNRLRGSVSHQTDDIIAILLDKKKDMVTETDIFTWTPLHYAAQLGHLEATRKLLECDKSVANLWDKEDSSALHIATKKGYPDMMAEIIKRCPCRTILHVAAQCGKSIVMKYTLKEPRWESLINESDNQGNTALHLAAMHGQYNSVRILAGDRRVDKKASNKKYLKAIDIVQSNMDLGEIKKSLIMRKLENGGAQQCLERLIDRENTDSTINDNEGPNEGINELELREDRERTSLHASESLKEITSKYLKDVSNAHLLVATLIATVTFAAGFSLPGGYNEDNPNKGKSVLSTKAAFKVFVITDAMAFYCSTAAVFLHFFASLEQNYHLLPRFTKFSALLTYISLLGMVIAFTSGIYVVLPDSSPTSTTLIVFGCLFLSFYIFGIL